MIYEFECDRCGGRETERRPVQKRDFPKWHNCTTDGWPQQMRRLLSVPQLITQPFHLKDENRPPEMSSLDRLARQKADDRVYEASYKAAAPDSGQSMAELASKMGVR